MAVGDFLKQGFLITLKSGLYNELSSFKSIELKL